MKSTLGIVLLAFSLLLSSLTNVALAGQWAGSVKYTRQTLTYTASTSLLGHATPFRTLLTGFK